MMIVMLALLAPAPIVKPPPPFTGTWESHWHTWGGEMQFEPDGSYCHRRGSSMYYGHWSRSSDGTITVSASVSSQSTLYWLLISAGTSLTFCSS